MIRIFDYCCKKCFYMWKSKNKYIVCPKCKSKELDIQSELKEN
jgi:Zn finger protein HypA/HybF involved in hydrogenase expression